MKKVAAFVLAALLALTVMAAAELDGAEERIARIRSEINLPDRSIENKLNIEERLSRNPDEAAGLQISERMRGQLRGLNQASTGAQDGISMVQTAEGALKETADILKRMRELMLEEANGELDPERSKQREIAELEKELARIDEEMKKDQPLPGNIPVPEHSLIHETVLDVPERTVDPQNGIDRVAESINGNVIDRGSINPDLLQEARDRLAGK